MSKRAALLGLFAALTVGNLSSPVEAGWRGGGWFGSGWGGGRWYGGDYCSITRRTIGDIMAVTASRTIRDIMAATTARHIMADIITLPMAMVGVTIVGDPRNIS
jgi:hypothetical protein